ncbi:MAG: hypothetical protein QGH60_00080 [Phycisphaerae bacterium]|jgi:hypothetical protein|nr:hypothetical protein [Phycisphaerae bacterium]
MRKSAIVLLLSALLLVGGCTLFRGSVKPVKPAAPIQTNTVKGGGMTLTIELPKRHFTAGENINIRIIARNTGENAIVFESHTSALYKVTIYRMSPAGWRWINQYPQAAMKLRTTWKLQPGQTVRYDQVVPVGRDWPVGEPLQLVAELVGAPDLRCPMIIEAIAPPETKP